MCIRDSGWTVRSPVDDLDGYFSSPATFPRRLLLDDRQYVPGGQDQVLLAGVLDLGAAVLAVEDGVADLDVERDPLLALVVPAAGADREDGALLGLLLGGVRDHDAGHRQGEAPGG